MTRQLLAALLVLLSCASALGGFPKVKVSYFRGEDSCDTSLPVWEWVWDVTAEPCLAFIAPNNVATGVYDSLSNPRFNATVLDRIEYDHRPRSSDCAGTEVFNKVAELAPSCVLQTEGFAYSLRITCVQFSADDPECTTEEYNVYVDRFGVGGTTGGSGQNPNGGSGSGSGQNQNGGYPQQPTADAQNTGSRGFSTRAVAGIVATVTGVAVLFL